MSKVYLPCEDGHGLLNIDRDICFARLPAVVEEVVAREDLLPSSPAWLNLSEIWELLLLLLLLLLLHHQPNFSDTPLYQKLG